MTLKFDGWPWKTIGHLFYATSSFVHHFVAICVFKLELQSGNAQSGRFLEPCDLEIWWMTLKNNRAPLLCCFQLCAWFHCHMWIQTGVRVRKRLSWVLTSVTLTFDPWPWPFAWTSLLTMVITPENFKMIRWWKHGEKGVTDGRTDGRTDRRTENTICRAAWSQLKTIGHLFYVAPSFVHHFMAISEFKLKLQSGNAQFGSKSAIYCPVWPRSLTDDLEKQ